MKTTAHVIDARSQITLNASREFHDPARMLIKSYSQFSIPEDSEPSSDDSQFPFAIPEKIPVVQSSSF